MLTLQSTGRVEILVRDASTREGVSGVPVWLILRVGNELGGIGNTVFTDSRGLATFPALSAGTYITGIGENYRAEADSLPFLLLVEAGTSRRIEVPVRRIAKVSGRIVDQNSAASVSAIITLLSSVYVDGRQMLQGVDTSSTSREGNFQVLNTPFGEYYLRIVSKSPWSISYHPGVTDLSAAQKVIVRDPSVSVGEIQLPNSPRYKVSGTVFHGPEDVGGTLTVYLAHDNPVMEEEPFETKVSSRRVSPTELQFELNDIPAGSYDFYAVLRDNVSFGSVGKETLRLEDRDVNGFNIALKPMVGMRGRILMKDAQSKLPQNLGIAMRSRDTFPSILVAELSRRTILPGSSGEYAVRGLIDGGRYGILLHGLPSEAYVSDIRIGSRSILADGVFVASPNQEAVEFQIATPGGIIRGSVRDISGQPVEAASVVAVPDFARRKNSAFYRRTTTDPRGQFTIQGLAPGEYQLFAWPAPPPPRAEEDPAFLSPFESRSTRVSANSGIITEATLHLLN
jgi:hypothetical protein